MQQRPGVSLSPFSSVAQSCPTLCDPMTAACQASLSITNSQSLFKLMSIESVMPSNHLILCRPLLLLPQSFPAPGSFPMSQLFTSGGQKCWSFSFSVRSSNVCSGLIYFRVDRLDLAIQWSVKSSPTPQFKSTILWHLQHSLLFNSHIHT